MKEAIVSGGPRVSIVNSPIPEAGPDQVLIRVICSGCNPKDWKYPEFSKTSANSGDDIAGIVHSVGGDVLEFRPGDRVGAFHQMKSPGGSFAEFALAPKHTTFHLPDSVGFEQAATMPLAAMTAAVGLYSNLQLPLPWQPATTPVPLVIYGGSSAVGAFAIKLARRSNVHPLIAVAGKGMEFVETMLDRSRGDHLIDYRQGRAHVVHGIQEALEKAGLSEVHHAFDAISEHGSFQTISDALGNGGHITVVRPEEDYTAVSEELVTSLTYVGMVHTGPLPLAQLKSIRYLAPTRGREFGQVFSTLFTTALREGWLSPHPFQIVPGGLNGVETALSRLRRGEASATKYVIRIQETP